MISREVPLPDQESKKVFPSQRDIVADIALPDSLIVTLQFAVVPLKDNEGVALATRDGAAKAVAGMAMSITTTRTIEISLFINFAPFLLVLIRKRRKRAKKDTEYFIF